MPFYDFMCNVCKMEMIVKRDYQTCDTPPFLNEIEETEKEEKLNSSPPPPPRCDHDSHKWVKCISKGIMVRHPPGWGKKGHW